MVNLFPVFTLIVIITILITTRELSTTMLIVSLVTDYIIINTQYTEQQHENNTFSMPQKILLTNLIIKTKNLIYIFPTSGWRLN